MRSTVTRRGAVGLFGAIAGSLAFFAAQVVGLAWGGPLPEPSPFVKQLFDEGSRPASDVAQTVQDEAVPSECAETILMYLAVVLVSGTTSFAVARLGLQQPWTASAQAMVVPYWVIAGLAWGGGWAQAMLSANPIGFLHTWFGFYLIPGIGALTGALVTSGWAGAAAVHRWRRRTSA